MARTTFGKTRDISEPYAVYQDGTGWEWKILKTYKHSDAEKSDQYARWFVAATSPFMHNGSYEMGDTYRSTILDNGRLVEATPEWIEQYASNSEFKNLVKI
tara:strand:+ start:239 stop:541 length:303 start_codon:yes stop_codon:yes gene_type:complete